MNIQCAIRWFLLAGAFLFFSGEANSRSHQAEVQSPLRASTSLVKIDVSVVNKRGEFVSGLNKTNFRVLDNGREQPIVLFTSTNAPAKVVLLIETSPAVYLIHNEHLLGAYDLLAGLDDDDQVSIMSYDQKSNVIQGFTANRSALTQALDKLQYTVGMDELNFYDSVSAVLDSLPLEAEKRAVVLLTTGLDSSSPDHWARLEQKLRGSDVVLFPVALGGSLRSLAGEPTKNKKKSTAVSDDNKHQHSANPVTFARADAALHSLANMTGGRAYFPQTAEDFVPIYKEIASALRHEYVLGIVPAEDGEFHKLAVRVLGNDSAHGHVFAREGYLAPQR